MVSCVLYESHLKSVWDEFVSNCRTPLFFFFRDFMEYHRDRFVDHSLLFYEGNKIIAVLPASLHENELRSHGGLTFGGLLVSERARATTIIEAFVALKDYMKEKGIEGLLYKAIPYVFSTMPSQEDLYALEVSKATLLKREISSVIRLDSRPKLSKGRKWIINKAKKSPLKMHSGEGLSAFFQLLSDALGKHGAKPVHSQEELERLLAMFPENLELKTMWLEGRILAATLLFKFRGVWHTQYMATNEEGKQIGALDLLIERCIDEAALAKCGYFSFGISTEQAGKYLNVGLIEQKEAFGARGVVLDTYFVSS